jgi:hypothetical protein
MPRRKNNVLSTLSESSRRYVRWRPWRLEDKLAKERRKAVEATAQFNIAATSEFF